MHNRICTECGNPLPDNTLACPKCGAPAPAPAPAARQDRQISISINSNSWSVAALLLSALILFIVGITAIIDSSTFLSRIHTTLLTWNLPLLTCGVIAYSFVVTKREGKSNFFGWIAVVMMFVALCCSNISKNSRQDANSNEEAFEDVQSEHMKSKRSSVYNDYSDYYDW